MPDNPHAAPGVDFALPDHRVIALEGPDAAAFAQAQTMNDVAGLADGHWQWNGWLTPKGRVVALFALVRHTADSVWLVVADADADALAAALTRFVFRSKVAIRLRDDLCVVGAFEAPALAHGARVARCGEDVFELDLGADGGARRWLIMDAATPARVAADSVTEWAAFDLAHGWPRLAAAQFDAWTPQQLSLDRLRAYSVKKGCYPGQEIVARTHFLGQAKRCAMRVRWSSQPHPGDVHDAAGSRVGSIVATADGESLVVLPLESGPGTTVEQSGACGRVAPFIDGLSR